MRIITFFLIAVAALAFAAHAGQLTASVGTTTSVEPAMANSLSDLAVSAQDESTEQTSYPVYYGSSEDGVVGFNIEINATEPNCTIYYRYMYSFPDGEWSEWMEYEEMLMFTELGQYRIEAYAVAPGKSPSQTIAFEFRVTEPIEMTSCPTINMSTFEGYQGCTIDIIAAEENCILYYRCQYSDGYWSEWMEYDEQIWITEPGVYCIEAYAVAPGKTQSEVVSYAFVVTQKEQTRAPVYSGYSEDGVQGFNVQIIESESDCTIYYRMMYPYPDGDYTDWMEYTGDLSFTELGCYRLEAYAVAPGKTFSETVAFEFRVVPVYQPGDVNRDGTIGINDVTTLIDIIITNSTPTPECDVNQDGSVGIADVTNLIDYILAQ